MIRVSLYANFEIEGAIGKRSVALQSLRKETV